jgi:hypothetical protein
MHAHLWGFWGLLEYANTTGDEWLKAFVRDGYEYMRSFGVARIGLFGEGCTVGDMTNLAIKLTDAGVGDYWEDVDQYVRNHLVELQIVRGEFIREIVEVGPDRTVKDWEDDQRMIERIIGALCDDATHTSRLTPGSALCCTYNGLIAYYHAWEAIARASGGVANVNLLLNRASPWLDVDSYLPYEGKVVIRNKTARTACVRIPRWVDEGGVQSTLNGEVVDPYWVGRYVVYGQLAGNDEIAITFPMVERTEQYSVGWEGLRLPGWTEWTLPKRWERPDKLTRYTCEFRGNTLVDISPREEGRGYPIYLRDMYRSPVAPMREVSRYASSAVIEI